jgi:superfamily II RNA helicase
MERLDTSDFHTQVPNMAMQYPFSLDVFQKEAVGTQIT